MRTLLLTLLALLSLLAVAEDGSATNGGKKERATTTQKIENGIRGVVVRWPIKPSSRVGETNSAPIPNVIVSIRSENSGPELTRQQADEKGRFEFRLPPGKYVIVPVLEGSSRFRVREQAFGVKEFTEVVVTCDTGMR